MRTLGKALVLLGFAAAVSATGVEAQAQPPQLGWSLLGEMTVGRSCERKPCRGALPINWRHPSFGLSTNASSGIALTGRMTFACESGSELSVPLPSVPAGGVATLANPCANFSAKSAVVIVERADAAGQDSARLRIFGSNN